MVRSVASLFLALLLTIPVDGAPRRRAAGKPVIDATPSGWLFQNAYVLETTELVPLTHDLQPLGRMIGDAKIVGLGDFTHGTREVFTSRLRVIDYLVREKGFDVVALEAPFPIGEQLNQYVQGGPGIPRALLQDLHDRLLYFFWNTEELLAVIEWMRDYNRNRGDKPAIELAGFDIYDYDGAIDAVVTYLQQVDPPAAARADAEYGCVRTLQRDMVCRDTAQGVQDRLVANRDAYVAATSARAYDDALRFTVTVMQHFGGQAARFRDEEMANNVAWLLTHRGASGKAILWGHQEHLSRTDSAVVGGPSLGTHLANAHGDDYFALGSLSGSATYRYWVQDRKTRRWSSTTETLPQPPPGSYESYFRLRGAQALLIPLRGHVPAWLTEPAAFRSAGTTSVLNIPPESLPAKLDAVLYVETSTPTTPLR